tara:strand:+ start:42 stop:311 length:270 start_codon:yes stop_codon:yes gene_type:complete
VVFDWDNSKNEKLQKERQISFERIVIAIEDGKLLEVLENPNRQEYAHQLLLLVEIDQYVWVVPTIQEKDRYFMITAFPSRKYTREYLGE